MLVKGILVPINIAVEFLVDTVEYRRTSFYLMFARVLRPRPTLFVSVSLDIITVIRTGLNYIRIFSIRLLNGSTRPIVCAYCIDGVTRGKDYDLSPRFLSDPTLITEKAVRK